MIFLPTINFNQFNSVTSFGFLPYIFIDRRAFEKILITSQKLATNVIKCATETDAWSAEMVVSLLVWTAAAEKKSIRNIYQVSRTLQTGQTQSSTFKANYPKNTKLLLLS